MERVGKNNQTLRIPLVSDNHWSASISWLPGEIPKSNVKQGLFHTVMSAAGDFGNPLRKFKLVFLGEQSGKSHKIQRCSIVVLCFARDEADARV